jgi:predicted nucleic acid-binding protein
MGLYTYSDANVILNAFSQDKVRAQRARAILEDTARTFVVSDYLWLETVPKVVYNKQYDQAAYIDGFFHDAEFVPASAAIIVQAKAIAARYGLAAMDALHVACAIAGGADELVTFEKPVKPFFRIPPEVLRITSLYEAGA